MVEQTKSWKRPAVWAAGLGWINLLGLCWLVVLRQIPVDTLTGLIWVLFFFFALVATAMTQEGKGSGERKRRE